MYMYIEYRGKILGTQYILGLGTVLYPRAGHSAIS